MCFSRGEGRLLSSSVRMIDGAPSGLLTTKDLKMLSFGIFGWVRAVADFGSASPFLFRMRPLLMLRCTRC